MLVRSERATTLRFAGTLMACLLCLAFLPSGPSIVAALAAAAAVTSSRNALGAIFVLFVVRTFNPGLTMDEGTTGSLTWIALVLASLRIWFDVLVRQIPPTRLLPKFIIPYAAVVLPLAIFFSDATTVSTLKASIFFLAVSAVTMGFSLMHREGRPVTPWLKTIWVIVLVLSLPTLAISSIGFMRDGRGFQGVMGHPQTFAVFLAPVVAWSMVQALTPDGRRKGLVVVVLLAAFAFMWLTRGRTGPAAILLSMILLLLFRPGFWRRGFAMFTGALKRPWVIAVLVLGLPILLISNFSLVEAISGFVFKSSGAETITQAFDASRGSLVDTALKNFENRPMTGIGFGVSNKATIAVEIDPFTGLPVGAATEKANLVMAVLEETGIFGMLAFMPFLLALVYRIARSPDLSVAWAAMAALCTNVSEMTFFSLGGVGLYTWLLIAWALSEYTPSAPRAVRRAVRQYLPYAERVRRQPVTSRR